MVAALGGRCGGVDDGQVLVELGQPFLEGRVEQLQEHGLPGLEVAQHVRLRKTDAPAEFVEADLGDPHLGEHLGRSLEDHLTAHRSLLFTARPEECRHARSLQTNGPLSSDQRSAIFQVTDRRSVRA